ncbi:MAG: M12 family metallo-peptidase [Gammaproteobacteria bacterium]|nr:M12 family metallo-peptidase [Gammaproteobacteria bacterium]
MAMRSLSLQHSNRVIIKPALICFFFGLTSLPNLVLAQELLIEFSAVSSSQLNAPAFADVSQPIAVYPQLLDNIRPGDEFLVQIGSNETATVFLDEKITYINGDLGIIARGRDPNADLRFTLTFGSVSLFGSISQDDQLWQLIATEEQMANGEDGFLGWVYHPKPLMYSSSGIVNDYFIPPLPSPQERSAAKGVDSPELPLRLIIPNEPPSIDAVSNEGINGNNFEVHQSFNSYAIVGGEVAAAVVTLTNSSDELHTDLFLEVYFVLEDSMLESADSNCSEQLSLTLQKVLRCELGNFAPGEQKQLRFSVRTRPDGDNTLLSTILIGQIRNDVRINIVKDVSTDSDQDGISDFNERLGGTDPADSGSVDYSNTVIDVLALYTGGAEAAYPMGVRTRINQLFSVANQIYRDSGVAISLRPVHHRRIEYSDSNDFDTALDHLMNQSHPAFSTVEELRNEFGADLVALFRPMESSGARCGLAPVGGFRTNGYFDEAAQRQTIYSAIAIDCPIDISLAHELGHNMGLTHSHLQDGYGGTFNFATGYGVVGQFVTVMAFPGVFNAPNRVPRFSNPDSLCLGFPCGVSADMALGADAVQTLNLVRQQIASYRRTTLPTLPSVSVASLSGITSAMISIAASKDSGFSFSNHFSPEDRVDLSAILSIDDRHVGSMGSIHVLIGENGGSSLFQLTSLGELVLWDNDIDSLIPLSGFRILKGEERLSLLNGFSFGEELVGINLVIYIAYWVPAFDDVVYTDNPLILSIVSAG